MFIMVCADFFYCCFGRSVSCNRLQAVRLSVIDYNIHVVDYVIDYNILVIDYRASVSINSKFQKPRERDFCSNSNPKSLNLQNLISPSILNQITSHKAHNSSFLIHICNESNLSGSHQIFKRVFGKNIPTWITVFSSHPFEAIRNNF